MTIMGCGGTGKSVLINTLVACIRKIFNDNNTVFVTAPTGAAAYNVRGSTIHGEFKINVKDIPAYDKIFDNTKKELMEKLLHTIALFFDERSMIGLMLLGQTKIMLKKQYTMAVIIQKIGEEYQ
jgi:predicted GTPase